MIHLIRHPPVAVPAGTCYGRSDVALLESPEALGKALRQQLPESFTLVSSPLSRCLDLARTLGDPRLEPRLMEIDFGSWELRDFNDIGHEAIDAWAADPLHFAAPGGESVATMAKRVREALYDILKSCNGPLVIVSHGGPLRVMAGYLLGWSEELWMNHAFGHGELQSFLRPEQTLSQQSECRSRN